jgi:hypothetical protein
LIVGEPAAGALGKRVGKAFVVSLVKSLGLADEGVEVKRRELRMGNGYDLSVHSGSSLQIEMIWGWNCYDA